MRNNFQMLNSSMAERFYQPQIKLPYYQGWNNNETLPHMSFAICLELTLHSFIGQNLHQNDSSSVYP